MRSAAPTDPPISSANSSELLRVVILRGWVVRGGWVVFNRRVAGCRRGKTTHAVELRFSRKKLIESSLKLIMVMGSVAILHLASTFNPTAFRTQDPSLGP
jgi:hypothetical protein